MQRNKRWKKRRMTVVIVAVSSWSVSATSCHSLSLSASLVTRGRKSCCCPTLSTRTTFSPCCLPPSVVSSCHYCQSWPMMQLQRIRGGGGGGGAYGGGRRGAPTPRFNAAHPDISNDDNMGNAKKRPEQLRGMAVALFATYFCVMGAKCALPSVLSLLYLPKTGLDFSFFAPCPPQQLMARQLTLATMAVALGKLVLGPIIDVFGGIVSLQVALTALTVFLASIASCHTFLTFAICWIFVDFIFSSCWAACLSAIHQCFPPDDWAGRVGMLAAAARTGNAAAFSVFASVLHYTTTTISSSTSLQQPSSSSRPWRLVFGVSAVMQLVPISLLTYYGRFFKDTVPRQDSTGSRNSSRRPSLATSVACLQRNAATPEFWLHFVSRSALMVFGSFLLFIPTLMTNCYGTTSAFGAQVGSIFALGCLLSVTFGSQWYSTLDRKHKIGTIVALLGTAMLSALAQLAHMNGIVQLSANASAISLFLFGFCFAIPFYIPPSLYALSRGGKASSATIADVFDFGGFGVLAIFNGYVASIQHQMRSAWIPTFEILSVCALLSLVALSLAIHFE